jgi:hypothetical protein
MPPGDDSVKVHLKRRNIICSKLTLIAHWTAKEGEGWKTIFI